MSCYFLRGHSQQKHAHVFGQCFLVEAYYSVSQCVSLTFSSPGARIEEFIYDKLDKKLPSRMTNAELLGQYMLDAAKEFGPGTPYGEWGCHWHSWVSPVAATVHCLSCRRIKRYYTSFHVFPWPSVWILHTIEPVSLCLEVLVIFKLIFLGQRSSQL